MNDGVLGQVRDSPIEPLLESLGIRKDRKNWACHVHEDKRPSCTVRKNRFKCWVCNKVWSNVDLIMEMEGLTLKEALKRLCEFYGIANAAMTPADRKQYAAERNKSAADARVFMEFKRGLGMLIRDRIKAAVAAGKDPEEAAKWHHRAHLLQQAGPENIEEVWPMKPEERKRVAALGRADMASAQIVTTKIVEMLAEKSGARLVPNPGV